MSYNFKIERTTAPKAKPADESKLGFGKIFTDHMFVMNYDEGQGWHDGRVVPYGPLALDPSSMVFHYAQELFEGLKAYRVADGSIQLFRPQKNIERMNNTCDRLCVFIRFGVRIVHRKIYSDDVIPLVKQQLRSVRTIETARDTDDYFFFIHENSSRNPRSCGSEPQAQHNLFRSP